MQPVNTKHQKKILVTGATGYVGGRLVPHLIKNGFSVRVFGRSINKLKSRIWARDPLVELFQGDVFDQDSLNEACRDCSAAYYLVHSMLPEQNNFEAADKQAAENMSRAAATNKLKQIIYLGGLGLDSEDLSKHLKSRHEVGHILRKGATPVTELRAAMIIGSGSASFEILRYLVERLPFMVTPKWLQTPCQPIAIRNVIYYLSECLHSEKTIGKTFDIGGPEILNYKQLIRIYSEEAGLKKRIIFPVPVLTPRLSSYWIHLVTPVSASIARPLAEGLKNPVICRDDQIKKMIPQELLTPRDAIKKALVILNEDKIPTHWTDAGKLPPYESVYDGDPEWAGGTLFTDKRVLVANSPPEKIWKIVSQIGGSNGWYHANWLWTLRGYLDKLFGGVGLRRGRRDDTVLQTGDALDFWRVIDLKVNEKLVLSAEMKLPGKAILEFKIKELENHQSEIKQTAYFKPRGLFGLAYWYAIIPLHNYIFSGMIHSIANRANNLK